MWRYLVTYKYIQRCGRRCPSSNQIRIHHYRHPPTTTTTSIASMLRNKEGGGPRLISSILLWIGGWNIGG